LSEPVLFNASQLFEMKTVTPDGIKIVKVKFPSDADWIERGTRRPLIKRTIEGKTQWVQPDPDDDDLELFNRLCNHEGKLQVDEYEACRIVDDLMTVEIVEEPALEAGSYKILLKVLPPLEASPWPVTTHILRMPTSKDRLKYEKATMPFNRGNREIHPTSFEQKAEIYKDLCTKTIGYVGTPPIVHMWAVINALFRAHNSAGKRTEPVNFLMRSGPEDQPLDS
jgi:hypothetical protein